MNRYLSRVAGGMNLSVLKAKLAALESAVPPMSLSLNAAESTACDGGEEAEVNRCTEDRDDALRSNGGGGALLLHVSPPEQEVARLVAMQMALDPPVHVLKQQHHTLWMDVERQRLRFSGSLSRCNVCEPDDVAALSAVAQLPRDEADARRNTLVDGDDDDDAICPMPVPWKPVEIAEAAYDVAYRRHSCDVAIRRARRKLSQHAGLALAVATLLEARRRVEHDIAEAANVELLMERCVDRASYLRSRYQGSLDAEKSVCALKAAVAHDHRLYMATTTRSMLLVDHLGLLGRQQERNGGAQPAASNTHRNGLPSEELPCTCAVRHALDQFNLLRDPRHPLPSLPASLGAWVRVAEDVEAAVEAIASTDASRRERFAAAEAQYADIRDRMTFRYLADAVRV